MEMDRDEVRVMTVHGAKGLEAPVVILADTTTPPQGWHPPRLLQLPPEKPVPGAAGRWSGRAPRATMSARWQRRARRRSADARDEYRRLLYVAMTRAAERLIVCGTQGDKKIPDGCWYRLVRDALEAGSLWEDGRRRRRQGAALSQVRPTPARQKPSRRARRRPWIRPCPIGSRADAKPDPARERVIRPSAAIDDEASGQPAHGNRARALLRGTLTHRLLQSLPDIPAGRRGAVAEKFLARNGAGLSDEERSKIAEQVMLVLEHPHFSELFGPGSRAEVPIIGRVTIGKETVRVSGQVDRLVVAGEANVSIADYKTGRAASRIGAAGLRRAARRLPRRAAKNLPRPRRPRRLDLDGSP